MYYAKNSKGYSPEWIQTIKNSVTKITPRFTTKRMMDDYFDRFYNKLAVRHGMLVQNNYKKAREIAAWKENIASHWDKIRVLNITAPDRFFSNPSVGEKYTITVDIDTNGLNDNGIGVELVAVRTSTHNNDKLYEVEPMKVTKVEGSRMHFETTYQMDYAGGMKFGIRMFPQNEMLPHRMDFAYVRWLSRQELDV
jgi:starch phosphorylase